MSQGTKKTIGQIARRLTSAIVLGALVAAPTLASKPAPAIPLPTVLSVLPALPVPVKTPSVPPAQIKTPSVLPSPISIPSVSPTPVTTPAAPVNPPVTAETPLTPSPAVKTSAPSRSSLPTGAVSGSASTSSRPSGARSPGAASNMGLSQPSASSSVPSSEGRSNMSGPGKSPPAPRPIGRRHRASAHVQTRTLSLIATVRRLQGCLSDLPDRLRQVLELRAGLNVPHALSPMAVAAHLHIKARQIPRLERRALRRLDQTARAHACHAANQPASGVLLLSDGSRFAGHPGARAQGGVEAVRYTKSPTGQEARQSAGSSDSPVGNVSGTGISPRPSNSMLAILVVLAAALMIGVIFADGLGVGPRHRKWRRRWIRRLPWKW